MNITFDWEDISDSIQKTASLSKDWATELAEKAINESRIVVNITNNGIDSVSDFTNQASDKVRFITNSFGNLLTQLFPFIGIIILLLVINVLTPFLALFFTRRILITHRTNNGQPDN